MRQVGVAAFLGVKGHHETVSEAVVETLGALVGTVLHGQEAGDLADHAPHLGETAVDLGLGDALLEDESSVVVDHEIRGQGDKGTR